MKYRSRPLKAMFSSRLVPTQLSHGLDKQIEVESLIFCQIFKLRIENKFDLQYYT